MEDFAKKHENILSDSKTKYDKVDSQLSSLIQNSKDNLVSLKTQNNESKDFLSSAVSSKSKVNLDAVISFKKESDEKDKIINNKIRGNKTAYSRINLLKRAFLTESALSEFFLAPLLEKILLITIYSQF